MTALPPSPHTPPKAINQSTANGDVRLYVYNLIRRYDEDLDESAAWAVARKVRGDGDIVLRLSKEQWIGLLGDWGEFIYMKVEAQKYVDTDTIWPWLTTIQSLLLILAGCITGYDLSQKNELKYTKGCGIAFLVDTRVVQIPNLIASTRWFEKSSFPTFLKHRPAKPGQSPWVPPFT